MSFKMKKDLWGLNHSAESATRQGNSSATPITKKASPFKMNAALVEGAAVVGMSGGFNNVAGALEKPSLSEKKQIIYKDKEPAKVPPPDFDEAKLDDFMDGIEALKAKGTWTKDDIVKLYFGLLPEFAHKETGKYLDQRM